MSQASYQSNIIKKEIVLRFSKLWMCDHLRYDKILLNTSLAIIPVCDLHTNLVFYQKRMSPKLPPIYREWYIRPGYGMLPNPERGNIIGF